MVINLRPVVRESELESGWCSFHKVISVEGWGENPDQTLGGGGGVYQ